MQAPTTLTYGNGFTRLAAGAIGLALLAASAFGAAVFTEQVDVPFTGGGSEVEARPSVIQHAERLFLEQNSFDFAGQSDAFPVAAIMRGHETGVRTAEEIRFLEWNIWDYAGYAQPAGDVEEPMSLDDYLFLEENIWGETSVPPHGEPGENY